MPCAERPLQPSDAGPAAQDRADAIADRDFLIRALARLPARQRTVLVLRYFNDLSEAETAGALGCTVGTVKSQASRGLAQIRQVANVGKTEQAARQTAWPACPRPRLAASQSDSWPGSSSPSYAAP